MRAILDKVIELRKSKKISQKEVGEELGISQAAYAKIEAGSSITIDRLYKIAEFLGVSVGDLLGIELPSNKNVEDLKTQIEELKKRISELEEQLNDKRHIIDFLSKNDLTLPFASRLYYEENPNEYIKKRDFSDLDSLLEEIEKMPYDSSDSKSQIKYIQRRLEEMKKNKSK
ncbi:helix-turn-helix domain-containing protein [Gaoshiqia sp. Z1-71]|uniref:helix-turn-helix domain-containing protein n=1 Tax=Gaoshiqia hydrogeniformans TaxID=3290090 RepID=UPI003BF7E112